MIDMKRTGQRIKETCDREGITVKQIQMELNIGSFQSVYSWFHGRTLPSLDNFYALCRLLHVSMDSMIVPKEEYDVGINSVHITIDKMQMFARLRKYQERVIQLQTE